MNLEDFRCIWLDEKFEIPNCNNCSFINITEEEQDLKKSPIHICKLYNKRVFHRTTNRVHNNYIYPCIECEIDKYKNYKGELKE